MSITTSGFNEVRQAVDMGIFRGRFGWRHQKQVRKSYMERSFFEHKNFQDRKNK